jgi:hypothetical protein
MPRQPKTARETLNSLDNEVWKLVTDHLYKIETKFGVLSQEDRDEAEKLHSFLQRGGKIRTIINQK